MRCKVTVIGEGEQAAAIALLLAAGDNAEVLLADLPDAVAVDIAGAGALLGFEPRVRAVAGLDDAAGSDVVVLTRVADGLGAQLALRCPDAIVVVATAPELFADCAGLLEATCFPRRRVIGVDGLPGHAAARAAAAQRQGVSVRDVEQTPPQTPDPPGPLTVAAAVRTIVDAIVLDGRRLLPCAVCCHGEHGAEGFATVPVVLGRRGVEEIR